MTTGSRIREIRKKKKLTQEYIADKLGMGRSNFGHIENDRVTPSSSDLKIIADLLDTTSDYLLGKSNDSSKHIDKPESLDDVINMDTFLQKNVVFKGRSLTEEQKRRVSDLIRIALELHEE